MIEFGPPHLPLKEGSSPDVKIPSLSWFGQLSQQPGDPPPFFPIWSQIELPAIRCRHFGGLSATLDQSGQGEPWTLQQDSTPSHGSKFTQSWIQSKKPPPL